MSSDLNHFAKELEMKVVETFRELTRTENELAEARDEMSRNPNPMKESIYFDKTDAQKMAAANAARERFYNATLENQRVKRKADGLISGRFVNLRKELEAAISRKALNPDEIDQKKMKLIEMNLIGSEELIQWMSEAEEENNFSMQKILADHARKIAEEISDDPRKREERQKLIMIATHTPTSENKLADFDRLVDIAKRGFRNPVMRDYWGELTGEIIEDF